MRIVVLDSASRLRDCSAWVALDGLCEVHSYEASNLQELMERCEFASVVVTRTTPLRREVLDYLSRMRLVVNISDDPTLVEEAIARDLGIAYVHVFGGGEYCSSFQTAVDAIKKFLA